MTPYSGKQFGVFRIVMGTYLTVHFARLTQYSAAIFSSEGMIPKSSLNYMPQIFPQIFLISDSPSFVRTVLIIGTALSVCFALGIQRRIAAFLLWYIWASLVNRNNLIMNPGVPFIGWLLFACSLIPEGELYALGRKSDPGWRVQPVLFWGAWVIMGLGYTLSGVDKAFSPGWIEGTAVFDVLDMSVARGNFFTEFLRSLPLPIWKGVTWMTLYFEMAFFPLMALPATRALAWVTMVSMHCMLLLVCDFPDLTGGMLMFHLFTFDPGWVPTLMGVGKKLRGARSAPLKT